ncbi:unnamed protein product [Paramecium pentaurelia]|uniref:Uncharacterized protein n=1 Tax=Paramecium pentaurelia TaxID=43138 RepID=A0A8S1VXP4_9CILI|nr:unnamed protein product [Paramecium pentaurelia]
MQITSQAYQTISTIFQENTSEIQNIEFICQELKTICTVSYQLISPKIQQKSIRKKKIKNNLQQENKYSESKKVTNQIQNNQTIQKQSIDSQEELESKITLIDSLQQQLLYLKMMISKM